MFDSYLVKISIHSPAERSCYRISPFLSREGEVDKISRLDSYEQLNDVKFEGFSSLQHDRSATASSGRRRSRSDKGTNTLNRRTVAVREYRVDWLRLSVIRSLLMTNFNST